MKNLHNLAFLTLLASSGHAVSFDDISYWIGSGSNRAAFVLDFNDGQNPRSYVWGFRWNGTATGETMLRAIDLADSHLEFDLDFFGPFGYSVNASRYLRNEEGFRHRQSLDLTSERYWSYWSSGNLSDTWTFSTLGMSQRVLGDGDVDGWAFSNPNWTAVAPTTPVPAVPEPATLLILGAGLSGLVRRRR